MLIAVARCSLVASIYKGGVKMPNKPKIYRAIAHLSLAAALLASADAARAAELSEKLCVFSAAEKAPNIVGMQIAGSSISKMSKDEAAKAVIGRYNNLETTVQSIDGRISFVDDKLSEALKYQYASGGPDAVRSMAISKLSASIDGGAGVDLQIKAAGQEIVFSYVCVWDALGRFVTSSRGAIR
ncbi:hypothetical protein ABS772_06395 [Methylorubrum podarium]|uniref:Uncharacterized protein n=1 Tax=Methylorubrum podarium TaxID=200476 RepID=A0ABV1QJH8_9HYPH